MQHDHILYTVGKILYGLAISRRNGHILYTVGKTCKNERSIRAVARCWHGRISFCTEDRNGECADGFGTGTGLSANNGTFMIVTIRRKRNG